MAGRAAQGVSIVFLTREGCTNTPLLENNLKIAISELSSGIQYQVLDQANLSAEDSRAGYPTPTILLRGHDLFGLPQPTPPFPAPS